jgi:ABC-2 type transport system ATP-binding protein
VKVALVIALAHGPELLILDEPTSGLDPVARRDFLSLVADLARQREGTILFSTHILSDVERIADRVIVMSAGRVVVQDDLAALRDRYRKASLLFTVPPGEDRIVPQAIRVDRSIREWVALFPRIPDQEIQQIASSIGATDCLVQPANLDDVYGELVKNGNGTAEGARA